MKKVIHHLRNQPEDVRRHVLHLITFSCAVILLLFWVYSLGTDLAKPETKESIKEDLAPFKLLKENVISTTK
ncbi:MAG: hypothetical protein K9L98_03185 [Candidatus Pacebacteria bacterium]|nr:hypothetical protein [Candidatus Paceibacterota bacterium]MCF7862985.1 hypothetical protein [Candidatus Paceibacterota bacterium]